MRPTRDLDGVRIGWEREGERGRRRNVYTGLVGQSFLLRRSFAKVQTAFNEIISHEREKKNSKSTRDRPNDRSDSRSGDTSVSWLVRLDTSGIAYRTVSLLPRISSASGVPVAKREEQAEERRRKLRDDPRPFRHRARVSIGLRKLCLTTLFPTEPIS